MVEKFKRGCKYCGKQIRMIKEKGIDKWMAWEDKEDVHHNCQQPYYEEPPAKEKRDKQMAPNINDPVTTPAPPPKDTVSMNRAYNDMARSKWEEEKKKIKEKANLEIYTKNMEFMMKEKQFQFLITEVTKNQHLLEAILEIITKTTKKDE